MQSNDLVGNMQEPNDELELQQLEAWMKSGRFAETTRPYSARDVLPLRPVVHRTYISEHQAKKLHTLLKDLSANGNASFTFGALDPVQVIHMAPYLSSIYVSGWQCSSTASSTNEPGKFDLFLLIF
jgi:isocitrate lyase